MKPLAYLAKKITKDILYILGLGGGSAGTIDEVGASFMAVENYVLPGGIIRDYNANWLRAIVQEIANS